MNTLIQDIRYAARQLVRGRATSIVAILTLALGIGALGAQTGNVIAQFLRGGIGLTLIGIGIGIGVSTALSSLLTKFLFSLTPTDVLTFVLGAAVLCTTAMVASAVPARRAAKVDPMVALRSE